MARILIVDDEPKIVRLVSDYLANAGFDVVSARSGDEALMRVRTEAPDLVVLDLGLPDMDGQELIRALRRETFDLLILDWNVPGTAGLDVLQWTRINLEAPPPALMLTIRVATVWDLVQLKIDPKRLAAAGAFAGLSEWQLRKVILMSMDAGDLPSDRVGVDQPFPARE